MEGYAGHLAGAALGILPVTAGERIEQEAYGKGRLCERLLLAAAHGVGSSFGWFAGSGVDSVREVLSIPPKRRVRTAISPGYPDEEARRRRPGQARKPLAGILHEERYA